MLPLRNRPLVLLAILVLAITGALLVAALVMGAPEQDVRDLAKILSISGGGSLLLGAAAVRWGAGRRRSLYLQLALAYGAGLFISLVIVVGGSASMFLSRHDLTLLLLLLGFAAVISLAFGVAVTAGLIGDLRTLAGAAQRLAAGDFSARAGGASSAELARLAAAFDHMAARLQGSFERERALEAGRRDLIAAVSHDLRTPLTTIRAMVEAVADGVVAEPAEVRRYLSLIDGEVLHLGRLIDDLFELSQIENGALTLHLANTPLPALLAQTLEPYRQQAREAQVTLDLTAPPDLPPVRADPSRLARVLRNLLDNALRHTPRGGAVRVAASPDGAAVHVTVSDTGPGIAPEHLPHVFDRFYRAEPARSRPTAPPSAGSAGQSLATAAAPAGAGLGLAIARGIVTAHGGRIWADPHSSAGATFHFTIPLAP